MYHGDVSLLVKFVKLSNLEQLLSLFELPYDLSHLTDMHDNAQKHPYLSISWNAKLCQDEGVCARI